MIYDHYEQLAKQLNLALIFQQNNPNGSRIAFLFVFFLIKTVNDNMFIER